VEAISAEEVTAWLAVRSPVRVGQVTGPRMPMQVLIQAAVDGAGTGVDVVQLLPGQRLAWEPVLTTGKKTRHHNVDSVNKEKST
jgi:hypothetical protein